MPSLLVPALLVSALLASSMVLAACGQSESSGASTTTAKTAGTTGASTTAVAATAKPASTGGPAVTLAGGLTRPKIEAKTGVAPKELQKNDVAVGTGAEAKAGSKVTVQYVGALFETGKEFDASWNRGQPFSFNLGAGQVIKGWDQGVAGMKVGGRRELVIPADLGYGSAGAGSAIPPNATLVFVVDLVSVG